jgi:hypothetical protein
VQGPEPFLKRQNISLAGIVVPEQPALLDPATRTVVNGHFFWVSSTEKLTEFRANPQRYTGPILDPVTHEWFIPSDDSPRRDTAEGILLFSGADTAIEFDAARDPFPGHGH